MGAFIMDLSLSRDHTNMALIHTNVPFLLIISILHGIGHEFNFAGMTHSNLIVTDSLSST